MNDFPVPLREEALEVDNYNLCYNEQLNLVIFTLSNHVLIYSLEKKVLLVVAQAQAKNVPYYIIRTATMGNMLYFSATEQKCVFGINLQLCVKNAGIVNYTKYKISTAEAQINQIAVSDKTLVALCSDNVLRVWDLQSATALKGVALEHVGNPVCLNFSKNYNYLLIGTSEGYVQSWDVQSLGKKNTKIMSQKISNIGIQSVSWFHYAGETHSLRFLAFTLDGNVKLYSFWFKKQADSYMGKCSQLSLLYINRHQIADNFSIRAHSFANFIFFSPGILLYMVDSHSLIYYPVIMKQPSASFDELVPNKKKQIYYTRDILLMQGLQIKRIKDAIEDKISLQNDLEYKQLKILRLDMRPWCVNFAPVISKLMVVYYLNSSTRVITLSNLNMNQKNETLAYKQYNGSWVMFIGAKQYYEPFILIVQEDKQTITVISENVANEQDLAFATDEQKKYFGLGQGQIYTKKTTIKIQKIYGTPFRYSYVVIYQSDNLLRFSNNINYDTELINYDVYTGISLRLDYTDIILDVVWTSGGEMGAVICLDKVVFINAELKTMKSVVVSGYVVQGQWLAYTLIVTTKKDVQFFDILSKPQQAFCLQSLECKYLIMRIMGDRVFGVEKNIEGGINVKARYFKIMEPLISGYLNYAQIADIPVDYQKIKSVIECFAPYFIVSEEFIGLLNSRGLASMSKYFLEGNEKMYSKPLRAKTLNDLVKIERFIPEDVWALNKKILMDLYLSYQEAKDSNDPYEIEKGKQYGQRIKNLVGAISFDSIKDLSSTEVNNGISINNNFGEQSLYQLYHDIDKDGQKVKMQIYPFKAENCGEWLGQFGLYIQSKPYFDEDTTTGTTSGTNALRPGGMMGNQDAVEGEQSGDDDQKPFKHLILYWRFDEGKGESVEDLSDYGNHGQIKEDDNWIDYVDEPMEIEDKWGKKCPPQFSLTTIVSISKMVTKFQKLSLQIWIRALKQNFSILKLGNLQINVQNFQIQMKIKDKVMKFNMILQGDQKIVLKKWINVTFTFEPKIKSIKIYLNSFLNLESNNVDYQLPKTPCCLELGDSKKGFEYTQLRVWRKIIDEDDIKQNLRTPLELVSQKRGKLTIKKAKKKKQKDQSDGNTVNPFAFDL